MFSKHQLAHEAALSELARWGILQCPFLSRALSTLRAYYRRAVSFLGFFELYLHCGRPRIKLHNTSRDSFPPFPPGASTPPLLLVFHVDSADGGSVCGAFEMPAVLGPLPTHGTGEASLFFKCRVREGYEKQRLR